jgi:hypothetical protein
MFVIAGITAVMLATLLRPGGVEPWLSCTTRKPQLSLPNMVLLMAAAFVIAATSPTEKVAGVIMRQEKSITSITGTLIMPGHRKKEGVGGVTKFLEKVP